MTPELGAHLATSSYIGYLLGAFAAIFLPRYLRSALALRISFIVLPLTLIVMPLTNDPWLWVVVRGISGVCAAIMFVVAANIALIAFPAHSRHLIGWSHGGVGAGIALSGISVLLVSLVSDWRMAWIVAAALCTLLGGFAWNLVYTTATAQTTATLQPRVKRPLRWFVPLVGAYFLEGAGYIIAGTFLVAAVSAVLPGPIGKSTWIIVGLTSIPSCVVWARLASRVSHPVLLTIAFSLQTVGIVLVGLNTGIVGAALAALLFGATFMGITTLALEMGRLLGVPSAVAILSAMFAIGQVVGPLAVTPLLSEGYNSALFVAAGATALGAVVSALLRIRYPLARRRSA